MSPQAQILLVDDDAAILENLAPFLERSGFRVSVPRTVKMQSQSLLMKN